jgi:hypothetical protein
MHIHLLCATFCRRRLKKKEKKEKEKKKESHCFLSTLIHYVMNFVVLNAFFFSFIHSSSCHKKKLISTSIFPNISLLTHICMPQKTLVEIMDFLLPFGDK